MVVLVHGSRTLVAAEFRAFCLGVFCASAVFLASTGSNFEILDLFALTRPGNAIVDAPLRPRRIEASQTDKEKPVDPCSGNQAKLGGPSLHIPMYCSLPIIAVLVMLSGLFSGLTLGLMGLDVIGLQIVERGGDEILAKCAAKIAPLRDNGNMLLCTLLLGNVAVNSALSILTADIANGLVGFLISTTLIVVFGEILPQAACSRYALQVGARSVPIVKFVLCLFYVFTKPMSIILDWLLGQEMGTVLSRTELMEMLKLQISLGAVNEQDGEMAKQVAEGAFSFRDKTAQEIMTPLEDMYLLPAETRLGYDTIREIFGTGFSRVPVYGKDKNDYVGLLYTKDLMLADPEDEMKLGHFIPIFHRKVETFFKDTTLIDALNGFKKGGTHMGLVRQTNIEESTDLRFEVIGVVTLEDVMEEIIQAEIVDETDVYVDVDRGIKVCDGREKEEHNLSIFNPVWKTRHERLSPDEVKAVAAHLRRVVFTTGSCMELSDKAAEWIVASGSVKTLERATPLGIEIVNENDWVYQYGQLTDACTLVLQGRLGMVVGRDAHRAEAGAFSVLAKDALLPHDFYYPDFGAFVSMREVRLLKITRGLFLKAQALNQDPEALQQAWCLHAAFSAGEISRKEARNLRRGVADVASPRADDSDGVNDYFDTRTQLPITMKHTSRCSISDNCSVSCQSTGVPSPVTSQCKIMDEEMRTKSQAEDPRLSIKAKCGHGVSTDPQGFQVDLKVQL